MGQKKEKSQDMTPLIIGLKIDHLILVPSLSQLLSVWAKKYLNLNSAIMDF